MSNQLQALTKKITIIKIDSAYKKELFLDKLFVRYDDNLNLYLYPEYIMKPEKKPDPLNSKDNTTKSSNKKDTSPKVENLQIDSKKNIPSNENKNNTKSIFRSMPNPKSFSINSSPKDNKKIDVDLKSEKKGKKKITDLPKDNNNRETDIESITTKSSSKEHQNNFNKLLQPTSKSRSGSSNNKQSNLITSQKEDTKSKSKSNSGSSKTEELKHTIPNDTNSLPIENEDYQENEPLLIKNQPMGTTDPTESCCWKFKQGAEIILSVVVGNAVSIGVGATPIGNAVAKAPTWFGRWFGGLGTYLNGRFMPSTLGAWVSKPTLSRQDVKQMLSSLAGLGFTMIVSATEIIIPEMKNPLVDGLIRGTTSGTAGIIGEKIMSHFLGKLSFFKQTSSPTNMNVNSESINSSRLEYKN